MAIAVGSCAIFDARIEAQALVWIQRCCVAPTNAQT